MQKSRKILVSVGLMFGALALSALAAETWQAPTQLPPSCPSGQPGCDAPINVGQTSQYKNGPVSFGLSRVPTTGLSLEVGNAAWFNSGVHISGLVEAANGINATGTVTIKGPSGGTTNSPTVALSTEDKIKAKAIQITGTTAYPAGTGKILVSDSDGNAKWQSPSTGSIMCVGQGGALNTIFTSPSSQCSSVATKACAQAPSCAASSNYETGAASGGGYWTTCVWTCHTTQ